MLACTTVMMCTSSAIFLVYPTGDCTNMDFVALEMPICCKSVADSSMDVASAATAMSASAAGASASSSSSASADDDELSASAQNSARILATGVMSHGSCMQNLGDL